MMSLLFEIVGSRTFKQYFSWLVATSLELYISIFVYSLGIYEDLSIEILIKNVLELNWEYGVFCSGK